VCEGDWGDDDNKVTMDMPLKAEFERDTEPQCWHVNRGGTHDDQYACTLCQAHQLAAVILFRFVIESLLGHRLSDKEWEDARPKESPAGYGKVTKMYFPRMFSSTYSIHPTLSAVDEKLSDTAYEIMIYRRW
jgi:hypothetical protein